MTNELREYLAEVQHAIWSHWMQYMFTQGEYKFLDDKQIEMSWVMPPDKVERWQRQMETEYFDLTEKERESDRHQADKVMAVLNNSTPFNDLLAVAQRLLEWSLIPDTLPGGEFSVLAEEIIPLAEEAVKRATAV